MRGALQLATAAVLAVLVIVPLSSQSSLPTRLLQSGDLVYQGSFTLPDVTDGTEYMGFEYSQGTIAFNPAHNSLFVVGMEWNQRVAEVNIPALGGVASLRQAFVDATNGQLGQIAPSDPNAKKIGGLLVSGDRLVLGAYAYYAQAGDSVASHFVRSTNLTSGSASRPFRVGSEDPSVYGGYMTHVPAEWQSALGGQVLTGKCCISVIARNSAGPAIHAVSLAGLLSAPSSLPAATLSMYPADHQTIGTYDDQFDPARGHYYGMGTGNPGGNGITGVVFPNGTASVLYVGSQGTGRTCYGTGSECGDPVSADQGGHAYPYRPNVWAYSAHDLARVRAGQAQPWEIKPYGSWRLPNQISGFHVGGAAYDPATGRIYISENYGDGLKMRIHVLTVSGASTAPPPPPQPTVDSTPPSVSITSPSGGSSVAGSITLEASATDDVGVSSVWFTVDGSPVGSEDRSAPFQVAWSTTQTSDGSHVIRASARDAQGNVQTSDPMSVTVRNQVSAPPAPPQPEEPPSGGDEGNGNDTEDEEDQDDETSWWWERWRRGNTGRDTEAPTVWIVSPDDSTVSGTVTLSAYAIDNVGVARVQFTLDGRDLGGALRSAPYELRWNSTTVRNGTYQLRAVARDEAGNVQTSWSRRITVRNDTRSSGGRRR